MQGMPAKKLEVNVRSKQMCSKTTKYNNKRMIGAIQKGINRGGAKSKT